MLNRLTEANNQISKLNEIEEVSAILEKLELELSKNKFGDLERDIREQRENALQLHMTEEDKEFVTMVD